MGLKHETREIDGISVTSTQFPAMKAYNLFGKLVRLAAPVFGAMAGVGGEPDADATMTAISALFSQLDEETADDLALKLLASTQVLMPASEQRPQPRILSLTSREAIDTAFEGQLMTMLGAMKLAIEVNFSDFIATALRAARERKAKAQAAAETLALKASL